MEFIGLPEHINCHHRGVFSPVIMQFEGGNDKAGFCIQEYKDRVPLVTLYGDLDEAKKAWTKSFTTLRVLAVSHPIVVEYRTSHDLADWFRFDLRSPHRVTIYHGPNAVCGMLSLPDGNDVKQELREALDRFDTIYRRFYNA